MTKSKFALVLSAVTMVAGLTAQAQQQGSQMPSPHDTTSTRVGGKLVAVYYGRPFAKGRVIWGGLVPWEQAWRLGANEATTLIAQAPVVIGGTTVPAGAYTLYMVPSATGISKLAISKTIGAWGIPVDEKNDLARVDLKKDDLAAPVEQLTLTLGKAGSGAVLKIAWEKSQYSVDISAAP
jgi:hypothetical protein